MSQALKFGYQIVPAPGAVKPAVNENETHVSSLRPPR